MKKNFLFSIVLLFALGMNAFAQEPHQAQKSSAEGHQQGSYTPSFKCDGTEKAPLNVILMIGDGMGLGALSTGLFSNNNELTMTNLRSIGFVRTQTIDALVTDSAASGTAYATGQKTKSGHVGVTPEGEKIENLPEKLSAKGIISGVVSTDQLTGATPAVFYAHQVSRKMTKEIWGDLAYSKLVFASAGSKQAYDEIPSATRASIEKAFTLVNTADDSRIKDSQRLLYLPDKSEVGACKKDSKYLPETTQMAIDYLAARTNKKKGFFLMVEGAKIDGASHGNKAAQMVDEVLYFDKAVEVAIRYAEKTGNTLVVISADHETGGVMPLKGQIGGELEVSYATRSHTGTPVPLFAYGPSSRNFAVVQENNDVANKILELLSKK